MNTVFLISPAHCGGKRAQLLLKPGSQHPVAQGLVARRGVPLAEVFTFTSQLYFRGKLAYAAAFARPPTGARGVWIIAPGVGLQVPSDRITRGDLERMAQIRVSVDEARYREPLERGIRELADHLDATVRIVLLGSVASDKYWRILIGILGDRLWFPPDLFGRGSLSRGSILLKAAQTGHELPYVTVSSLLRESDSGHATRRSRSTKHS